VKKNMTQGGKLIEDVEVIAAKIDGGGKTGSHAASESIVPVPQIDTYSELPFALIKKAAGPTSPRSAPAAGGKKKLQVGSSKPSKSRQRHTSKSRKKRAANKQIHA
jgi:hypothetical protein